MQRKLTGAGYLASVLAAPYPPFPAGGDLASRIVWAREAPVINAVAAKSTLLVLASMASMKGMSGRPVGSAWPEQETLARYTGQSLRSVRRAILTLVGRRWLLRRDPRGEIAVYFVKSPAEWVCIWCGGRWKGGPILCEKCGEQAELFQPVAA